MMDYIRFGGAFDEVSLMGMRRNYMTDLRRHSALLCKADT